MTVQSRLSATHPDGFGFDELRAGRLGVRLARSVAEVEAAQGLRYRVFFEEMGADPAEATRRARRDSDPYDEVADHLLVLDHSIGAGPEAVVGCYRLIRETAAARVGRFYSEDEYDISSLLEFGGTSLELGRSCVSPDYRSRAVMQLLWRGIAAYVYRHDIDLMFGCASLPGTEPDRIATELSYLYYNHLAPPLLRPRAVPERHIEMRRLAPDALDHTRAINLLPPLIKGYLRLGGFVGDGAVLDRQFNTIDVAVVVKTELITDKYYRHYQRQFGDLSD